MSRERGEKEKVLVRYAKVERLREREELLAKLSSTEGKAEALEGIVVVDVSHANFAGIIAASLFAEFGAEVIKVEPPEGDPARKMTPFGTGVNGVGIPFLNEARNKRFITLELETEEGQEDFKRLVSKADILIDCFSPGEMDSKGIGYRQLSELNPGLIYIAISPYGHYSAKGRELSKLPDSDLTSQAASGLPAGIGDPPNSPEPYNWPLKAGIWAAWYITGINAALGGLLALLYRQATGEGQMVDIASFDSYASCVGYPVVTGFTWGKPRPRIGVLDFVLYPYGFWKTKDGYVVIAAPRDHDFRAVLKILGLWRIEDDWRYGYDRVPDVIDQAMILYKGIEQRTLQHTADELIKKAMDYSAKAARSKWRGGGVPIVMKVQTTEAVLRERNWQVRKTFQEIYDQKLGRFIIPAHFVKMSETPPRVKWVSYEIGQDNEYVRKKFLSS